jgi:hypothetical protein
MSSEYVDPLKSKPHGKQDAADADELRAELDRESEREHREYDQVREWEERELSD